MKRLNIFLGGIALATVYIGAGNVIALGEDPIARVLVFIAAVCGTASWTHEFTKMR